MLPPEETSALSYMPVVSAHCPMLAAAAAEGRLTTWLFGSAGTALRDDDDVLTVSEAQEEMAGRHAQSRHAAMALSLNRCIFDSSRQTLSIVPQMMDEKIDLQGTNTTGCQKILPVVFQSMTSCDCLNKFQKFIDR